MKLHENVYALIVSAFLGVLGASMAAGAVSPIKVHAQIDEVSQKRIALRFTLHSVGKQSLDFYSADLPWGIRDSLILVLITNDASTKRVTEVLFIDDPGPDQVVVASAAQLGGTVDLDARFPSLKSVLKDREVIVFWSYQPTSQNGVQFKQQGGAIVLPKLP